MTDFFPVEVTEGRILFGVIRTAIKAANFNYSKKNERAILIWYDTLKDIDYFSKLRPWQIVNRLPSANIICRKAPFVRLIQRIQTFFPQLYDFLPKSFILPIQNPEFNQLVSKHEKKYIIKTDCGSLGLGITIIDEKKSYTPVSHLSIAQEYIESCLIDQTKFDCRVYVLITSIEDLQIYVYRGGIARFCSQRSGTDSIYSQITNTHINRKNSGTTIDKITRMIPDTFNQLARQGADIELLWKKIDKIAVSTILSAYSFLLQKEKKVCPNYGYSRCFQILGFDILIDKKYNPYLLEVNYRPSLDRDTELEGKMKCEMLSEAMRIAVPLNDIQKRLSKNKTNYNENGWRNFLKANPTLLNEIEKQRKISLKESHFVQAYPSSDPQQNSLYKEVIQKVETLPTTTDKKYRLPLLPSQADILDNNAPPVSTEKPQMKLPPINSSRSNSNDVVFLQLSDSLNTSLGNSTLKKSSSNPSQVSSSKSSESNKTGPMKQASSNLATPASPFLPSETRQPNKPTIDVGSSSATKGNGVLLQLSDPSIEISEPPLLESEQKEKTISFINEVKSAASSSVTSTPQRSSPKKSPASVKTVKSAALACDCEYSEDDFKYYVLSDPSESNEEPEKQKDVDEKAKSQLQMLKPKPPEDVKTDNRRNRKINEAKSNAPNNDNDKVYFIIGNTSETSMRLGSMCGNGCYTNHNFKNLHGSTSQPNRVAEKSYLPKLNQPIKNLQAGSNSPIHHCKQFDQKAGYNDSPKMHIISKKYTLADH